MNKLILAAGALGASLALSPQALAQAEGLMKQDAATSGNPRFFLGTDSAPHSQTAKETSCGCAGMFSAHAGIELYAEAFDTVGRLNRLEGFAAHFGADFYRLPRNQDTLTLIKDNWSPPPSYAYGSGKIIPMRANESIQWRVSPS